ncbi:MAG TPA: hypothetical protein VGX48_04585 [Pyrinomonadaceae bacterium]|jgi:hypothetical protein|nr:hypothetical protein [Pyrinomonadaceae bacterium]
MSSERDRIRDLAERVARRLGDGGQGAGASGEAAGGDLSDLRASLSEIQRRLSHIETHLARDAGREQKTPSPAPRQQQHAPRPAPPSRPTYLSGTYVPAVSHPSQEQFAGIGEAVSELVDFFESEKTCTMEPGAKPCDHCGACSSRGF